MRTKVRVLANIFVKETLVNVFLKEFGEEK